MTDTNTSQSQQNTTRSPFEAAFPFAGVFEDQLRRWEAMQKEYAALEERNIEQARTMITEGAKLLQATLDHSVKLSHEWRKLALESARQTLGAKA